MSSRKSVQDQVTEIQSLIADASETLRQANWALETLVVRLGETDDDPVRSGVATVSVPAPPRASVADAEPPATGLDRPAGDVDPARAGPAPADAHSVDRRRRHRPWVKGSAGDPPADSDA
jgi:hypothetical protein